MRIKVSSQQLKLRQPIIVVLGHVDHGKTTLLDKIRGTAVVKKEVGEMTQEVGASFVPSSVIEEIAKSLNKIIPIKLEVPGLLFIDTPGHELFSNLRKRGGSVADIAILVVDITEGFQKQTYESVEILKSRKVPFIVAANKIDRIPGWVPHPEEPFLFTFEKQTESVKRRLDNLVYNIVAQLAELGFNAERFDRIKDFTKTLAIVPVSAKTGEGIPELLALLAGLTQRYMKGTLKFTSGPGKGVILEVKEEPGLGHTIDVILYDGILKKNDTIVLGGINGSIVTKVRSILVPKPLIDMRIAKSGFEPVDEASAAAGVKILAPDLDNALAGSPLFVATSETEIEKYKKEIEEELSTVRKYKADVAGIVVKADSIGTLEALVSSLESRNIPIRVADVGPISKKDVMEAEITAQSFKEYGIIAGFRVKPLPGISIPNSVKFITDEIIYNLIDNIEKYISSIKEEIKTKTLNTIILPAKIKILPGYVFRRSNPAIVGIEVLGGIIRPKAPLITADGRYIGEVLQIQDNKKSIDKAIKGMEVAVSIKGDLMIGRQIDEGDVLYADVPKDDLEILVSKYKDIITDDMKEVIKELIKIKRVSDPLYGLGLQL